MKKVFLSLLLGAVTSMSFAQSSDGNEAAAAALNEKGHFGHFDYRFDDIHTINVNYSITPKVPTDKIEFMLHTPEARPLSVAIVNSAGVKVKEWNPTQDYYIREGVLDVKGLPAGNYKFVILWDKKVAKEISFDKK